MKKSELSFPIKGTVTEQSLEASRYSVYNCKGATTLKQALGLETSNEGIVRWGDYCGMIDTDEDVMYVEAVDAETLQRVNMMHLIEEDLNRPILFREISRAKFIASNFE